MTTFDPNTAHVLPNDIVKALARVSNAHGAAYLSASGCVEQGDGEHDLANLAGVDGHWRTIADPEAKAMQQGASDADVVAVAQYAKAHGLRLVFEDMEQAEAVLAKLPDGGRLSSLVLPIYKAELVAK